MAPEMPTHDVVGNFNVKKKITDLPINVNAMKLNFQAFKTLL